MKMNCFFIVMNSIHIKILILVLFVNFTISCQTDRRCEYWNEKFDTLLIENIDSYDTIIVVPEAGCTGCISKAEQFYIENQSNDKILFIFTNIVSIKTLLIRLGRDVLSKDNVYIDSSDLFFDLDYADNIYPHKINRINGEVTYVETF